MPEKLCKFQTLLVPYLAECTIYKAYNGVNPNEKDKYKYVTELRGIYMKTCTCSCDLIYILSI